jgi:HSP20 family protein
MENNVVTVNTSANNRTPLKALGRDIAREYDRIVDSVFHASAKKSEAIDRGVRNVKVDVAHCDKQIEVFADLPGVDEKHLKVELRDGALFISGERELEAKQDLVTFDRQERCMGTLERSIALPCDVEKSGVEAVLKDGVLRVILPKTAEARNEVMRIRVKH